MFTAAINWVHGKHEIKAGMDLRYLSTYSDPLDLAGTNGQYFFSRAQTALPTNLSGTGSAFASMLLGAADSANRGATPVVPGFIRYQYYAGYVQDNWRVTSRLTLNLGLRYEVPRNWMAQNGDYSGLDLSRPNPGAGNRNGALVFYGSGAGREGVLRPYPRISPTLDRISDLPSDSLPKRFSAEVIASFTRRSETGAAVAASGSPIPLRTTRTV